MTNEFEILLEFFSDKNIDEKFFIISNGTLELNFYEYVFKEVEDYIICEEEHFCISKSELETLRNEFKSFLR